MDRFPEDFMFELDEDEFKFLRSQIVTSKTEGRGEADIDMKIKNHYTGSVHYLERQKVYSLLSTNLN